MRTFAKYFYVSGLLRLIRDYNGLAGLIGRPASCQPDWPACRGKFVISDIGYLVIPTEICPGRIDDPNRLVELLTVPPKPKPEMYFEPYEGTIRSIPQSYRTISIPEGVLEALDVSQPRPGQTTTLQDVIRIFLKDEDAVGSVQKLNAHLGPSVVLFERQIVNASHISSVGGSHTTQLSSMKLDAVSFYLKKEVQP